MSAPATIDAPARNPGGRPSKMDDPELVETLLEYVRAGNFLTTACRAAGVSYKAFKEWMSRGNSDAPEDAAHAEFRERILKARAQAETAALAIVKKAGERDGDWRSAMAFLERSFPRRWGKVNRAEVTINKGPGPFVTELSREYMLCCPRIRQLTCELDVVEGAYDRGEDRYYDSARKEWVSLGVTHPGPNFGRHAPKPPPARVIDVTDDPGGAG